MERLRISLGLVAAAFVIMLLANGVRASSHRDSLPSNDKDENPNSERMFFKVATRFDLTPSATRISGVAPSACIRQLKAAASAELVQALVRELHSGWD